MCPQAPTREAGWPFLDQLPGRLATDAGLGTRRGALREGDRDLARRFHAGEPVEELVRDRARLVDSLVLDRWHGLVRREGRLALVAVGGFGRGELHPCSDIDIMVLLPDTESSELAADLERFVTALWDLGLEVGHSVRTVSDCEREARADITVATTLMESRLLAGDASLYETMRAATGPEALWPSADFFAAKWREQEARHLRYDDTAYNLEPNIKEGPGGLRDIQMVAWVLKRHFGADSLAELVDQGFLTEPEYDALAEGQRFLWRIRFALHLITGRREDRLLFDHQMALAHGFGYEDASGELAVEQFMQRYYLAVMDLSRLNEMLLQLFQEAILDPDAETRPIDPRFRARGAYLEVADADVFRREPGAILDLFRTMQFEPGLKGVSARTIRILGESLDLIDEGFRADPENHRRFLDILRAPRGVTHELRRMNRYGVLGRYIPAFGRIAGRMQYDLFHAYTVDAHTLFVISNLRRFALPRYDHEYPDCSRLMQTLSRPELIYLAALFHDIAKGRGGDHSVLGAEDAQAFCLGHGLSRYDARLVAWLVRHHLSLSVTAQKRDISDPRVIHQFAREVGDQTHLDYLYLLTVADVRGTNPKLWNSWKASLFEELYQQTRRALRRGLENPIDRDELIRETRNAASELLEEEGVSRALREAVWEGLGEDYFLAHSPEEIAWHTQALAESEDDEAIVRVRPDPEHGGTVVFIYAPRDRFPFADATAVLDESGLSILDARITRDPSGHSLDTYVVLEDTGAAMDDPDRLEEIRHALLAALAEESGRHGQDRRVHRRTPRQVRMFSTPTRVVFQQDPHDARTAVEITAADRPGLLSELGRVFRHHHLRVQMAKITTVGERAEDVFFLSDESERALGDERREALERDIVAALAERR